MHENPTKINNKPKIIVFNVDYYKITAACNNFYIKESKTSYFGISLFMIKKPFSDQKLAGMDVFFDKNMFFVKKGQTYQT